jgi:hypothetical protein
MVILAAAGALLVFLGLHKPKNEYMKSDTNATRNRKKQLLIIGAGLIVLFLIILAIRIAVRA